MSNVNKPVIPAEIAELIENMRKAGVTNQEMTRVAQGHTLLPVHTDVLTSIPFDTLLAALVNGYERELTEEQRMARIKRELTSDYITHRTGMGRYDNAYEDKAYADGIERALDAVGVKIEGVNA
ncbi:hypothetical protein [Paenibacillus tundrae]|uniref:Uncharacterized protein n=1 Tax=Paenibacillus tundrae TaxID=528187 RepID=A0ABT9W632_9BACL|nr:hypothetical protein [Paenibacillus tundrae]MDQ0168703.1 hypothetical protein [Paenibacillus tundrae]